MKDNLKVELLKGGVITLIADLIIEEFCRWLDDSDDLKFFQLTDNILVSFDKKFDRKHAQEFVIIITRGDFRDGLVLLVDCSKLPWKVSRTQRLPLDFGDNGLIMLLPIDRVERQKRDIRTDELIKKNVERSHQKWIDYHELLKNPPPTKPQAEPNDAARNFLKDLLKEILDGEPPTGGGNDGSSGSGIGSRPTP